MGMDRNMKYMAGKDYKRAQEVNVSSEFTSKAEAIALAHAACGSMAEYQLMFTSLGKVNPMVRVERLEAMLEKFLDKEGVSATDVVVAHANAIE